MGNKIWICKNCKSEVVPKMKGRGTLLCELFLWLAPIVCYILFAMYAMANNGWTFEQFVDAVDEINTIGTAQPAYLNYSPNLIEIYDLNKTVEGTFSIWIFAAGYTLWRFFTKKRTCPVCNEANYFVPQETPEGIRILSEVVSVDRTHAVVTAESPLQPANTGCSTQSNIIEQLEKLNELKQKGVLSDEEFEAAKKKLLS